MRLSLPPVLLLALFLVLLATQVASVLTPRQPPYLVKLAVSCGAFLIGEALAALGVATSVAVGELHLFHDLGLTVVGQWLVSRVGSSFRKSRSRRPVPRQGWRKEEPIDRDR